MRQVSTKIIPRLCLLCLVIFGTLLWCRAAIAAEEAERFLRALKERGYFDLVVEYIEQMRTSPLCPDSFREVLDYELGVALVDLVRSGGPRSEQVLEQARTALERFLREKPTRPEVGDAAFQLANVLIEIGKLQREQAEQPGVTPQDRDRLLSEARSRYQQAQEAFAAAERRAYERARNLEEEAKKDPRKEGERDEARRQLLRSRIYLAGVVYELARTYPPDSAEFKKYLEDAGKRFEELFEKYKSFTAGLYAGLQLGRIRRELGDTKGAVETLKTLRALMTGVEGEERAIANEALAELLETYIAQKNFKSALEGADAWSKEARAEDETSREGLMIAYAAGRAALELARQAKGGTPEQRQLVTAAREYLTRVARAPGPLRRQAQALLGDPLLGTPVAASEKPTTYQEARDKADEAWGTLVVALGRLGQATQAEEKKKVQSEVDTARDRALELYKLALELRPEELSLQEVNLLRFRMCYLFWLKQDYYRAAVLGEYLARTYQQSPLARQGAEIAAKAYRVLYIQATVPKEERTFETQKIRELVQWMSEVWPNEPETAEARMMLLDTAIDNRDLDEARQVLSGIPEESPRRAEGEIRLGQALWAWYVRELEAAEEAPAGREKLQGLVDEAQKLLSQGLDRKKAALEKGAAVDYVMVAGARELARVYLELGKTAEAVSLLENERFGPLTLVRKNDPVVQRPNFATDTLTLALRVYVAAQALEKAETVMGELEKAVAASGDRESAQRLTQVYINLARQLQESLRRLRQEGRTSEAQALTQAFELFLNQIRTREAGNTFTSLNWVAETFFNMAASLEGGSDEDRQKAVQYYKTAAAVYLDILKKIQADKTGEFAPPNAAPGVQLRLAAALRGMGRFEEAVKLLVKLLQANENRVNLQVELAKTYQAWGDAAGKSEYYTLAITGGHQEKGRNIFWGWAGIARRVAPYPNFQTVFHEAWYNIMLCRMKQALLTSEKDRRRDELLRQAETDAYRVYQLYPDMGGDEMRARYDSLLRRIQKLRGIANPTGVEGFAKPTPTRTARAGGL
ncbi:MAG: hypothetical protein NZ899_14965 [Thermoguttaceae bacterium]|nr:hypothetical protein [Thermoguttaceae bacterium]MDW8078152.1 hypothetical protein [Thermoguttaceae bacterium]